MYTGHKTLLMRSKNSRSWHAWIIWWQEGEVSPEKESQLRQSLASLLSLFGGKILHKITFIRIIKFKEPTLPWWRFYEQKNKCIHPFIHSLNTNAPLCKALCFYVHLTGEEMCPVCTPPRFLPGWCHHSLLIVRYVLVYLLSVCLFRSECKMYESRKPVFTVPLCSST